MKSKIAGDSGETCRRMILAPNQAELDMRFSLSLGVVLVSRLPSHMMSISFFPICEAPELGLNTQLEDLDLMDSHCE